LDQETKRELIHTGTIGAIGVGTGILSAKIGHMIPKIGKSVLAAGAVSGALGLAGDYGAVKAMKHMDNKNMTKSASNKYLEKIASSYKVQHFKDHGAPTTDKGLAGRNTALHFATKLTPRNLGIALKASNHMVGGRSLRGAAREEVRGKATEIGKSVGYGLTAAAGGAVIGAIAGKLAGNMRVAKFGANMVGRAGDALGKARKIPGLNGKNLLDRVAHEFPEQTKKILSHKYVGVIGGAAMGAAAGLVPGSMVGSVKGQYDGRLTSIRNQIQDGSLKNVTPTGKNKK